jgi:K+-transporting ATPase ATPase A chain
MTASGWIQIGLFALAILAITKPLGLYMYRVFEGERQPLPRLFGPLERFLYRLCGVDPLKEQGWKGYTAAMLLFSLFGLLATYAIERLQHVLPFNPQKLGPVPADLAWNTAASFTTNTNWQNYGGESTMSYLVQMAGLTFHNFVSAAPASASRRAGAASPASRDRPAPGRSAASGSTSSAPSSTCSCPSHRRRARARRSASATLSAYRELATVEA